MTQAQALLFNPLDPAFRADPYPAYARLRDEAPRYRAPNGAWVFSRYADCVALLKDPRASSDARRSPAFKDTDMDQELLGRAPPFLILDPPDHTRLRGLVSKAFTPKVVEGMRPHVQHVVDALLDAVAPEGTMDVIDDLAYPLPLTIICELLGVPVEDHPMLRTWSRQLSRGMDPPEVLPPDAIEQRREAGNAFVIYFRDLVAQRRSQPRDDLLSALIAAEEQGDKLTEEELISTCILLLAAGHETTVNLIGNGVLALLRNPDQLALLRNDPSLVPSAVEEFLRYDAPVQFAFRTAREPFDFHGEAIGENDQIVLLLGSANRDPEQFADAGRLDITRRDNRHLAFGFGVHFCLGAPLARLEAGVLFRTLVSRVRDLTLLADAPEYREHIVNRGLRSLPVSFAEAN